MVSSVKAASSPTPMTRLAMGTSASVPGTPSMALPTMAANEAPSPPLARTLGGVSRGGRGRGLGRQLHRLDRGRQDPHRVLDLVGGGSALDDGVDHVHALHDASEDGICPRRLEGCLTPAVLDDEETGRP